MWEEIERIGNDPTPEQRERIGQKNGRDLIFETREADRDVSFLRRWLTDDILRDLDLFRFEAKGDDLVVSDVADDDGWRNVKETLLKNVGMGGVPVIRVEDADFGGSRTLLLAHDHDGRDLHLEQAEKTLAYVHRLWGHEVVLDTTLDGKRTHLVFGERGFASKPVK
jgi:stage V sporulation protein R